MKKIGLLLFAIIICAKGFAQAPQGFNYQAVVRNSAGTVITNQTVGVEISILLNGNTIYIEHHAPITSTTGLINLVVGQGTVFAGDFNNIDWSTGTFFIEVGLDAAGGTSYVSLGSQQLMSVPFALYAASSSGDTTMWRKRTGNPSNILHDQGPVDIGNVTNLSPSTLPHSLRSISADYAGVYGATNTDLSVPAVHGVSQNGMNNNQIGVMGEYNGAAYGSGVAGIGYNGNYPPASKDIGVYGSAGNNSIAIYSDGRTQIVDGTQGTGKVLTSDADGVASWQTPSVPINNSMFKIEGVANGSFGNNLAYPGTRITFNTEVYDYGNTQTNSAYSIPTSGVYHIDARFNFGITNTQSANFYNFFLILVKNGGTFVDQDQVPCTHNPYNDDYSISISGDYYFNAGDYITIYFNADVDFVTDPGSVIIQTGSLSGHKIR